MRRLPIEIVGSGFNRSRTLIPNVRDQNSRFTKQPLPVSSLQIFLHMVLNLPPASSIHFPRLAACFCTVGL